MGTFEQVSLLMGDLAKIARRLNYPESSICVLTGDLEQVKTMFPQTYSNLMSCGHHADKRGPLVYGKDLVASWIMEDYLMENLKEAGVEIQGAGADKKREILSNARVSTASDCLVSYGGKERPLELMSDYTGYWAKYKKMELRDAKFKKMQDSKSLFLGVSTADKKYLLLDMSQEFEFKFIPSYFLYGGKPAYSIKFPKEKLNDFDFKAIAEEIKSLI